MRISIGSRLYKCFHEGGHVVAAVLCGAKVTCVKFDHHGSARTSITHNDITKKPMIACGGFAVESILFDAEMIVDGKNVLVPKTVFKAEAMDAARRDKYPFYIKQGKDASGHYPGATFEPRPDST